MHILSHIVIVVRNAFNLEKAKFLLSGKGCMNNRDTCSENHTHYIFFEISFLPFYTDLSLKAQATEKAFETFEKSQTKGPNVAKPKEGVVSERLECKFHNVRVKLVLYSHTLEIYTTNHYNRCLIKPLNKQQILDASKLKEFADKNFEFDKNDRKFTNIVENTVGKGEIAHNEQFLLFPQ